MLKLDNDLLDELGLGSLPEDQKQGMLQHIYETLELRVGTNLANQMTDQQLDEFEKFIDDKGEANQAQALQWLEANLPNYKQVVNDVFEQLKAEIRQMAPQLLAASGQQSAQVPTQPIAQTAPGSYAQPAPAYQVPPQPSQPYQQPMGYQQQPPQPMQQPMQPPMPAYDMGAGSQLPPAGPAQPSQQGQQQAATPFAQPQQDDDQTDQQRPPAGPGGYPPQHPAAQ